MLPKTGRKLPLWTGVLGGREVYARTIAELLRKEHGDSRRAIKQLMRQTDASERTVKHWLSGQTASISCGWWSRPQSSGPSFSA